MGNVGSAAIYKKVDRFHQIRMRIDEVFTSAGVTPRSHNLASCSSASVVVFASGQFLVVEKVPDTLGECGHVVSVSECRHSKAITVVKRAKAPIATEIFVSGGSDGRLNLWKLTDDKELKHICTLEAGDTSIAAVTATVVADKIIVIASWGEELSGSLKAWWLRSNDGSTDVFRTADMSETLVKRSFVLAMDCHVMQNGLILLAVGTSLRKMELYIEDGEIFSRKLSVVGHTDWIHSIAFNDRPEKLLLASAGQDTYIKLWKIEESNNNQDEEELSVTKNKFCIQNGGKELRLIFNVEAVIGGHEDWVHSTEWNLDGTKLVTASSDKTVIVWEEINELWSDSIRLGIIGGQAAGFFAAVFTPDSKRVVASSYFGGLHCWMAGQEMNSLWSPIAMSGGHVGEIRDASWSPEGHYLISVGKDQTTRLFAPMKETSQFVEVARPQVHGYDMQSIVSISNSCFVSGGEEKIYRAFRAPETFANSISAISGYSKEQMFAGQILEMFGARLPALGLSNKAIDAGDEPEEDHWEEAAFQANPIDLAEPPSEDCLQQNTLWPEQHKLYGHGFEVYAISCNPSRKVLATACKASHPEHACIMLWDIATWAKMNSILGHQLTVTQLQWSPNGEYLLSVSRDRTAILYKEKNGDLNGFSYEKVWSSGKEHSRIIWSCGWLEDSKYFVTVSRDLKIILWKIQNGGAAALTSVKMSQPITAVAVGTNTFKNTVACGLQDGSLAFFILENEKLHLKTTILTPPIILDNAVSRLSFHPKPGKNSSLLAYAGTNGLLRILKITL